MEQHISMFENGQEDFQDTIYIGLVSLLSTVYVQTNNLHAADTLLSHAIDFMVKEERKSSYFYSLYVTYGGLLSNLQNYSRASLYLDTVVNFLKERNEVDGIYAVILSMLAECHRNLDELELAKNEIEEAISILETDNSPDAMRRGIGIYQKAGVIFHDIGQLREAIEYTRKAYEMSKDKEEYVSEFINAANNLAILYIDSGKYDEALGILHQMETLNLSDVEKSNVYNSIALANYFLGRESEAVKYMSMCSQYLKSICNESYSSFPSKIIEEMWDKYALQLKVNMNILDKYANNCDAVGMCYDNALFLKNVVFESMQRLRQTIDKNEELKSQWGDIKALRSRMFVGEAKREHESDKSIYTLLDEKERTFIAALRNFEHGKNPSGYVWRDVRNALQPNEYAVEIITYGDFSTADEEEDDGGGLRYGALLLSKESDAPQLVDLCTVQELHDTILHSLIGMEFGINKLYLKYKGNTLYHMIWERMDSIVRDAKRIYISPILGLQQVNIGFIPCPDGGFLNEKYDIRIVSSTSTLCKRATTLPKIYDTVIIYGGIEYEKGGRDTSSNHAVRSLILEEIEAKEGGSIGFSFLQATEQETDSIEAISLNHLCNTVVYKGAEANETSVRGLDGSSPSIIHFATHAFYLVGFKKYTDYFNSLFTYYRKDNSMLLSGLLMAGANETLHEIADERILDDGVLTAEELSLLDFSNTRLVVLSACETAIGTTLQEGIGGLLKAFKMAGVETIVASLWKVPDESTAMLMTAFYKYLFTGEEKHSALKRAQLEVARHYPDPYYWAAFIMLD